MSDRPRRSRCSPSIRLMKAILNPLVGLKFRPQAASTHDGCDTMQCLTAWNASPATGGQHAPLELLLATDDFFPDKQAAAACGFVSCRCCCCIAVQAPGGGRDAVCRAPQVPAVPGQEAGQGMEVASSCVDTLGMPDYMPPAAHRCGHIFHAAAVPSPLPTLNCACCDVHRCVELCYRHCTTSSWLIFDKACSATCPGQQWS